MKYIIGFTLALILFVGIFLYIGITNAKKDNDENRKNTKRI